MRKEHKMYNAIWSIPTLSLPLIDFFKIFGVSVACAIIISLTYIIARRNTGYRPSVVSSIMLLAPAVCLIMLVVGDSAARAISIGGGIAFIRYRSTLEDPRDLTHILVALASGIACGTGLVGLGLYSVAIICAISILISFINFGKVKSSVMRLKITIPEDINFYGIFDETLKKYCKSFSLDSIKTADFGTLCELTYTINIKNVEKRKELIDEIRVRNANMNVVLTRKNFEK